MQYRGIPVVTDNVVRVCQHRLTVVFCPRCRNLPRNQVVWWQGAKMLSLVTSDSERVQRFDDDCPWCQYPIHPGETLYRRAGEWVCGDCRDRYDSDNPIGAA